VPTVGKTPEKSDKSAVPPTVAPPLVLPTPPPPSAIPTVAASALPKVPPSKPKADDLFNAN
jgi:hypothetical protein